jgi:hypothetical protein
MDPYTQFQRDIAGRLAADPFFATIPIVAEDQGVTEQEVEQALAAGTLVKGGKAGAAVIVFQSEEETQDPDVEGPRELATVRVRCLETPRINRSAAGTALPAQAIAQRVKTLCHLWLRAGVDVTVRGAGRYADQRGVIGKDVILRTVIDQTAPARTPTASIAGSAAAVTLSCGAGSAAIYYTTDGTFPGPGASLYTGHFAVAGGTLVRAAAYLAGSTGSDITQLTL